MRQSSWALQSNVHVGGGFSLPISPAEHLNFLHKVQKDLQTSVGDVGVTALEYCSFPSSHPGFCLIFNDLALTPGSPFPTQLRQVNAAISHLVSKGTAPANLILGGDSAGGNLALQIASHILHPLPNIPALATSSPLGGAFLISPWVTFDDSLPSFAANDKLDTTSTADLNYLAELVRPGITPETRAYFEPCAADDSWWTGLEKVFPRILSTAGGFECLCDPILAFGETLKKHVKDTTVVLEKNGVHEDILRDFAVGEGDKSNAYKLDIEWLSDTFKGQQ